MKNRVNLLLVLVTVFSLGFGIYGVFFGPRAVEPQTQSDMRRDSAETERTPLNGKPAHGNTESHDTETEEAKPAPGPESRKPDPEPSPQPERDPGQTGRITGVVVDRMHEPVEGARITAVDMGMREATQRAWTTSQSDEELEQSIQDLRRALVNGRTVAYTDAKGRFEIAGLDAASYFDLEGFSPMHGTVEMLSVRCGKDVTLRFKAAGVLAVRLENEDGEPITRTMVCKKYDDWASMPLMSSNDGRYLVEFEAYDDGEGVRSVTFKAQGYLLSREFTLEDVGKQDLVAVLKKGARVYGTLADEKGRPIRSAMVRVKSATLDSGEKFDWTVVLEEKNEADADGHFEFSSLPPGLYEFKAWLSDDTAIDGEVRTVRVSGEHEVNFTLDTGARAHVVVAVESGEDMPRFSVNFWRESSDMPISALPVPGSEPDQKSFIGLPKSVVQISVYADGFCTCYSQVDLSSGNGTARVTLSRGAMVTGRVVGSGGVLVGGVRTRWTPVAPGAVINRWGEAPKGTFSLGPLEPGAWTVDVYADVLPTEKVCTQTVQLAAGQAPVDVVLDPAYLISVTLTVASGISTWANVNLTPQGEETWESIWHESEGASSTLLIAVPSGAYQLYASTDRLYSPVVNAKSGESVTLTLKDPDCVRITGVTEGSNADRSGMLTGDLVIEYDLQPVRSVADLVGLTKQTEGRTDVRVIVLRNGETVELVVKGGMLGVGASWAAR